MNTALTAWTRSRNKVRPRADAVSHYTHSDDPEADLLIEGMADTIVGGLYRLHGLDMPPMMEGDPKYQSLFDPVPGRSLWTLDDLINLDEVQADPDLINLDPFLNLALKPSSEVPSRLHGMTPRMGLNLTTMRQAEFVRVARWLADQDLLPARPNTWDFSMLLKCMGYGEPFDPKLEVVDMPTMPDKKHLAPRNSKRSPLQQYALMVGGPEPGVDDEDQSPQPFCQDLLEHPPFDVDLGPEVHRTFHDAVELLLRMVVRAKASNKEPGAYLDNVWHKAQTWNLTLLETEVVPLFLHGHWDFPKLYTEELSAQQHITLTLVRCMAQITYRAAMWRYHQPYTVLALSIVSGISPAIFVDAAIRQLARTGLSFLGESHIDAMAQAIRNLPRARSGAAQALREDLVSELSLQVDEYLLAQDGLSHGQVDEAFSIVGGGFTFPAWGIGAGMEDEED